MLKGILICLSAVLLVFLVGQVWGGALLHTLDISSTADSELDGLGSFEKKVARDIKELRKSKIFPKEIENLGSIQWLDHRKEKFQFDALEVLAKVFAKSKNGSYQVLVEGYDVSESQDPAVEKDQRTLFFQISIFHLKTKNKIFEITRHYPIPDQVR